MGARWHAWLISLVGCYSPTYPAGSPCDDAHPCPAPLVCDPRDQVCRYEPLPDGATCAAGYELDLAGGCVDIDECARSSDDCAADAACTNTPGGFDCRCNPGFAGDGRTCNKVCSTVLLYSDCPAASSSCPTLTPATAVTAAAQRFGLIVDAVPTADEATFRAKVDAGGFELMIFDGSRVGIDQATASSVASWVDGGGRSIVTYWNLGNNTTGLTMRTALRVDTIGSFTTPLDVYRDPTSPVDLFGNIETVPSPLTFANVMVDDGDELALPGAGFLAARQRSATGTGALAVTRDDRAITLGFLPLGLVSLGDTDADGKADVEELYTNQIGFVCGY